MFRSAGWDHGHDLAGRRVAVIGTGASAIQFVPRVAERAGSLKPFQRTPPWILPKLDRPILAVRRRAFRVSPTPQRLYRAAIYTRLEAGVVGFRHPAPMAGVQLLARLHIRRAVADPALLRAATPGYTLGCKRVLLSNDYYPALARDNVEVVTKGAERVTEHGVVTADGCEPPGIAGRGEWAVITSLTSVITSVVCEITQFLGSKSGASSCRSLVRPKSNEDSVRSALGSKSTAWL